MLLLSRTAGKFYVGSSMYRKGQISSFLKPIQIIVFVTIFVTVIGLFLNFELGLTQQESNIDFQQNFFSNYHEISDCLKVDESTSPGLALNKSKLLEFERSVSNRQLPCASIYEYGYNVSVEQDYLQSITQSDFSSQNADIALVIDRSGSMRNGGLSSVKDAARSFVDQVDPGTRIAVVSLGGGVNVDTGFTEDKSVLRNRINSLSAGGGTPLGQAISTASNLDWDNDKNRGMIVLSDGSANDNVAGPGESARENEIDVHGIMYGSSASPGQTEAYTGSDDCSQDDSENSDGDNCWYAASGETLQNVYQGVGESINSRTARTGADNTCSLPAVETYEGSADIVFVADASASYGDEWSTICGSVTDTVDSLENKGLDAEVSIYAPGNPENPGKGAGRPMNTEGGEYDYREESRNVPRCLSAEYNSAVESSYGKGITEWEGEGLPDYNSNQDYGLEAWGVASKWILENHEWRENVDTRNLYVFGDHVPTGGPGNTDAYMKERNSASLENETSLVENITDQAVQEEINVYTFEGDSWEYSAETEREPFDENDAKTLMENLSSSTAGLHQKYNDVDQISEGVVESFKSLQTSSERRNFCSELEYSFGQEYSEPDNTVSDQATVSYPATVKSGELYSPGDLTVEVRRSDLTSLAGGVQRLIDRGRNTDEEVSSTVRINIDGRIETEESFVTEKPVESTYRLLNGNDQPEVEVSDELVLGINGNEVLRNSTGEDENSVEIDFTNERNQFNSTIGSSIQHIAINRNEDSGMLLDQLKLECISCSGNEVQELTSERIDLEEGSDEYEERNGLGAFEYNSTQIQVGEVKEVEKPALCIESGSDRACNTFDISTLSSPDLRPGEYVLNIQYFPETEQVVIND